VSDEPPPGDPPPDPHAPFGGDAAANNHGALEAMRADREEPPSESSASLRLANGPLVGPVLCRVVSIVLARANCPMDRMEDAMLICDALSAHAPTHAEDGCLAFAVSARGGRFELRVGDLAERGASRLVRDTALPGVGSVLERVTDELRIEPSADGAGEELVLGLVF
jgi:anti-sigma regulatory factor (Ser/Thr protein kinase)